MGIIIPKSPGYEPARRNLEKQITLENAPKDMPAGGPDAQLLNPGDFPQRPLPSVNATRDARFQVVFRQSVLDEIHAHGKASMEAEVCGVLVGDVYADHLAPWCYVEHCIRGNDAVGRQTQVTITSETWSRIHEQLDRDHPGKKIVGWYHTHPGFGIFLSGMDTFIQENFFNQSWQIASVYDPHSREDGIFVWKAGKSVREPILIENDIQSLPNRGMNHDVIEDLQRRVRLLERRLDFILTGFLVLVLIALLAPLAVVALKPDTMKRLPALRRLPSGGTATQPGILPSLEKETTRPAEKTPEVPVDQGAAAVIDKVIATAPATTRHAAGVEVLPLTRPAAVPSTRPSATRPSATLLRVEPETETKSTGGPRIQVPKKLPGH